jgi:hypothetical protein
MPARNQPDFRKPVQMDGGRRGGTCGGGCARASLFPLFVAASRAKVALSILAREHSFEEVNSEYLKEAVSYGISREDMSSEARSLIGTFFSSAGLNK